MNKPKSVLKKAVSQRPHLISGVQIRVRGIHAGTLYVDRLHVDERTEMAESLYLKFIAKMEVEGRRDICDAVEFSDLEINTVFAVWSESLGIIAG